MTANTSTPQRSSQRNSFNLPKLIVKVLLLLPIIYLWYSYPVQLADEYIFTPLITGETIQSSPQEGRHIVVLDTYGFTYSNSVLSVGTSSAPVTIGTAWSCSEFKLGGAMSALEDPHDHCIRGTHVIRGIEFGNSIDVPFTPTGVANLMFVSEESFTLERTPESSDPLFDLVGIGFIACFVLALLIAPVAVIKRW